MSYKVDTFLLSQGIDPKGFGHVGVKGMRWGVRKRASNLEKANAKIIDSIPSEYRKPVVKLAHQKMDDYDKRYPKASEESRKTVFGGKLHEAHGQIDPAEGSRQRKRAQESEAYLKKAGLWDMLNDPNLSVSEKRARVRSTG